MKGLTAAAGRCTCLQDPSLKRNQMLPDLGGKTLLGGFLNHFAEAGIADSRRATSIFDPFQEQRGIPGSTGQGQAPKGQQAQAEAA
jgi:hypothetical protein